MLILNTLLHEMVMHWFVSSCKFQAITIFVIAAFLMTYYYVMWLRGGGQYLDHLFVGTVLRADIQHLGMSGISMWQSFH